MQYPGSLAGCDSYIGLNGRFDGNLCRQGKTRIGPSANIDSVQIAAPVKDGSRMAFDGAYRYRASPVPHLKETIYIAIQLLKPYTF